MTIPQAGIASGPDTSAPRDSDVPLVVACATSILQRAATDDAFQQRLPAMPRAAVEQELRVTLPPDIEIQVVEETPTRRGGRLRGWPQAVSRPPQAE